jgi:predicted RNA binding protein YcfA (HicA-like mRNA interferase family)
VAVIDEGFQMATKGKVRDILKMLREDGWIMVNMEGSHRQFKHPTKSGRVTVNGKPGDDISTTLWYSICRQAGWR